MSVAFPQQGLCALLGFASCGHAPHCKVPRSAVLRSALCTGGLSFGSARLCVSPRTHTRTAHTPTHTHTQKSKVHLEAPLLMVLRAGPRMGGAVGELYEGGLVGRARVWAGIGRAGSRWRVGP